MTPKEALKWLDEHNTSSVIPLEVKAICSKALENQIPRCYGVVINPNEEPFIIEFKRNYVTTLEFIDGVWVAHRKHKEEDEE